jgi:hypothetical protein
LILLFLEESRNRKLSKLSLKAVDWQGRVEGEGLIAVILGPRDESISKGSCLRFKILQSICFPVCVPLLEEEFFPRTGLINASSQSLSPGLAYRGHSVNVERWDGAIRHNRNKDQFLRDQ